MSQWQFMLVGQCARYLGCSEQVARRRLRALREWGVVDMSVPFADMRQVYWVNSEGLRFVRGRSAKHGGRFGPKISQFAHDRILVDIAVRFSNAQPDYSVFGEVEMRRVDSEALERGDDPQFAIRRFKAGRHVLVFPDMSAVRNGRRFVIEYEHTRKDRPRLESLINGYLNSSGVSAVKYYGSPAAFPQLQRVYSHMLPKLPLVGGKPKLQIELYDEGAA